MSKIASTLRRVRRALPVRDSFRANRPSPFICDHLNRGRYDGGKEALEFLEDLGMPTLGVYDVFGHRLDGFSERQMDERRAWLLFAADLADEWGEP